MLQNVPLGTELDHEEDAAAAKLWAVYVSEAEKYDKALVETWKSDMEGLLIFAALFSAILTAFIIESYRLLNPDSGDVTVQLTFNVTQSTPFTPAPASLVCNGLWFISLGFSLACALIATLVQQWSANSSTGLTCVQHQSSGHAFSRIFTTGSSASRCTPWSRLSPFYSMPLSSSSSVASLRSSFR
ncbi:hypothetical protein B0H13DRAFT_1731672 [Mycena leptocephala]|nr:hypothetical protein B0H13DRAFT_1731672 [Mycena leptocephala]